jgi:DNA (cytosine-5)-methyltransferase 1
VALDLFAGAGGMSLGFEQAGFDVLAAIDIDPLHLAIHTRNFPKTAVLCEDVSNLNLASLEPIISDGLGRFGRPASWDGSIDCIFGGPSCQGFSEIGKRDINDERNDLVFAFARIVSLVRPRSFVMENVPGFCHRVWLTSLKSS